MPIVSLFKNCHSTAPVEDIEFLDVLHRVKGGYWQDEYFAYRSVLKKYGPSAPETKKAKEGLSCFIPSGRFSGGRKRSNLAEHSGVLNIDIDAKHNIGIDLPEFKDTLFGDKHIYAGHLSVSGLGLSLYVKINPEKHIESFLAMERYFAEEFKIIIDPACKDVTRLRFVGYDTDLYINERAVRWGKYEKKEAVDFQRKKVACCNSDIEYVLQQIEQDRRDITTNYADGVKIAFAFNTEFGEAGVDFFQRVCQFRKGYDPAKTALKYKQCNGSRAVSISSFFWIARQAGYEITAPKTKEIIKTAKYAKKAVAAGVEPEASAKEGAVRYAVDMQGESPENAKKLVDAVFDGAAAGEKESADEIYEFIKRDIEGKRLRRNLINDCVEYENEKIVDRTLCKFMVELRSKYGSSKVKRDVLLELIETSAKDYNPMLEFFEKNRHKSPKGCIDAVIDAISGRVDALAEGEAKEFRRYFIRKWLLGMVSGWHGTYSLLTLVLVGDQGTGKSKWFRGLFPEELQPYYAEAKMDGDKDHLTLMTTKALILDDEFSGKSRREEALFKEVSSKQEITIRKPYARMAETHRRIAALAGTTNDENIKGDLTGNRRILAVHVSAIDWELYNSVDKVDLMVELYKEWKRVGDGWMLTGEDIAMLNGATDRYREICPEEELLVKYFDPPEKSLPDSFLSNTEIFNELSGKLNGSSIRLSQRKLGQVLKKFGYVYKSVRGASMPRYAYNIQRMINPEASPTGQEHYRETGHLPF